MPPALESSDDEAEVAIKLEKSDSENAISRPNSRRSSSRLGGFMCPVCKHKVSGLPHFQKHLSTNHDDLENAQARSVRIPEVQEHLCSKCLLYFPTPKNHTHRCNKYIAIREVHGDTIFLEGPHTAEIHRRTQRRSKLGSKSVSSDEENTEQKGTITCPVCHREYKRNRDYNIIISDISGFLSEN